MKEKYDIYQAVTDRVMAMLEQGVIPWSRPWVNGRPGRAISYSSRRPYTLLNQLLLDEGEYITFKECEKLGGSIRKGAKAKQVVFWKRLSVADKDDSGNVVNGPDGLPKMKNIPLLRYFNVFNITDCEGIESRYKGTEERPVAPLEEGERVIREYVGREPGLTFTCTESSRAFYSPSDDEVVLPRIEQFNTSNAYYATAFHELTHSTLAAGRCDRVADIQNSHFGNGVYSKEELVAEMGSAYLMQHCGIDTAGTVRNSVAYIQSWLSALANDKKMVVAAAGKAEYAAKYILLGERRASE